MYLKLDYDKERKEFVTKFWEREDMENKETTCDVKPEKYIGKYCLAKVAVKVDSVFVLKLLLFRLGHIRLFWVKPNVGY